MVLAQTIRMGVDARLVAAWETALLVDRNLAGSYSGLPFIVPDEVLDNPSFAGREFECPEDLSN
ncbi:hypothetical protein [Halomarina rubra]|uniref:Uncharacterized protein n=1 Tax=Halomarina rubra TaxID=2071873 RepID=A0ABD6ARW5_9EURY|nr:hypothetical protein [Halomarina rubra]